MEVTGNSEGEESKDLLNAEARRRTFEALNFEPLPEVLLWLFLCVLRVLCGEEVG
jgi:hypothetical protein